MSPFPEDQIAELRKLSPGLMQGTEAGVTYFLLPQFELPEGCTPGRTDVLLCPTPRDGYDSRVFFAAQISSGKPLNWNHVNVRILERNWSAYSWKVNHRVGLRLAQILLAHLQALR